MNSQPIDVQIFLNAQRGLTENGALRSAHTLNTADYVAEGREPVGRLRQFDDETLRPGQRLDRTAAHRCQVLLVPLTGGLDYFGGEQPPAALQPGEAVAMPLPAGAPYAILNPYATEAINYLHLVLTNPRTNASTNVPAPRVVAFDLTTPNHWQPFALEPGCTGLIGRFGGRQEGTYTVQNASESQPVRLFVFVVQGVFEVANRLLQARDGLALTYAQASELDFEALSNDALLLLLDLRP